MTSAERFALPVPGGRLCGDARGAGPPVVLLHGFTLDRRAWDGQVDALAAVHRVVRLDLRGHGASSDATAPYLAADDVARALDALDLPQAALVGLSWGGAVALDFTLVHPGRVSALALVDSTLPGHDWSPDWRALTARLKTIAQGKDGAREAARAWFGSALFGPARAHPELLGQLAAWETPRAGRAWAGRDPALAAQPLAATRLGAVAVPTLVVVGEHDLPDYQAIAHTLARNIPGARRVVIPAAGHLPNLEAPAELTQALLAFLAGATGARVPRA